MIGKTFSNPALGSAHFRPGDHSTPKSNPSSGLQHFRESTGAALATAMQFRDRGARIGTTRHSSTVTPKEARESTLNRLAERFSSCGLELRL
jgi:hypothetical protein